MRWGLRTLGAGVAAGALIAAGASASGLPPTEIGALCGADARIANSTVIGLSRSSLQLAAPDTGVITGWKVQVTSGQPELEQRLQVFRSVGTSFVLVAESAPRHLRNGANSFPTRIPVLAGDRFGLRGSTETFVCDPEFATSGVYEGPPLLPGAPHAIRTASRLAVPVRAIFELDEDGDGFGDETQDRCDRDATTQDDCPAVGLRVGAPDARQRAIVLPVSAGTKARIAAVGETSWSMDTEGSVTIGMFTGEKLVSPGRTARLRMKLHPEVRKRLGQLAPRKAIRVRIKVWAVSDLGRLAERKLTLRLPGRAKPQR